MDWRNYGKGIIMEAQAFYKLDENQKLLVFRQISEEQDLPIFAVEKDWWVVQTLNIIFQLDISEDLLFKGGTSLNKAWHIINRFSEDIDLALNREYLGFSSELISKAQVRKLRTASFEFVTTTFYKKLQNAFQEKGFSDVSLDFEDLGDGDQDPVSILINYPAVTTHTEYVLPRVKVELGSRSLKDPFTNCEIVSFVGGQFSGYPFADRPIIIPCVNPERTFLEKLFLLHEEFQKPQEKIRVERLSRHLYDITRIFNTRHKVKAYNKELIISIIKHRERFNGLRGIDYNSLFPPRLKAIPPEQLMKAWEKDYKIMQNNMIPGESPDFLSVLEIVDQALKEYNVLNFK